MRTMAALILGAILLTAGLAMAQDGDKAKGETLIKSCSCHKTKGDLDGKPSADLARLMRDYKDGKGANKPMITIMQKFSDTDMADLAAYYASLPPRK